ncbi:MAG: hypothetical protein JW395_2140 [Nitrospira sp.]|nr:hypothetical protein [Nitrospira sp.]
MSETVVSGHIDVTPSPRVLRMLGQIDFQPWQCLAELVDNSIDAFIDSRAGRKALVMSPGVEIALPLAAELDRPGVGTIVVRDNGPGMSVEELSKAIKAGYSGNDPVEKLGLFGMGFNIATARLGRRTVVETATAESDHWSLVEIDFDELERTRTFAAPLRRRPKSPSELENGAHGTEIRISKLEAARIRPLIRGRGKAITRTKLGKIYGRVMADLGISIKYDGDVITPRRHCVWDRTRAVPTKSFANVHAVLEINEELDERRFCTSCWVWLENRDVNCPACGLAESVIMRKRSIKGWIGVQRYFHQSHYGLDLIRNGRVIQELDKSLFYWTDPDSLETEIEYPVDATHWGGRIVGELEIDFVRVSHQKDAFDKLDPEWRHVVERIRGESPLRPQIAKHHKLAENTTPLARLFAGYRNGYAGLKSLVPGYPVTGKGNNGKEVAVDWVEKFHDGDPEFQSDQKWFDLVLEAEKKSKGGGSRKAKEAAGELPDTEVAPEGEDDRPGEETPEMPEVTAIEDTQLSGVYQLPQISGAPTIRVKALSGPIEGRWPVRFDATGNDAVFQFDPEHPYFETSLMSPSDCLISDLAYGFLLRSGAPQHEWPLGMVEAEVRRQYFPETTTSVDQSVSEAGDILRSLQEHLELTWESAGAFSAELPERIREQLSRRIMEAELGTAADVERALASGRFVRYLDRSYLPELSRQRPELVLDGRFFAVPYLELDPQLREEGRNMIHEVLRDIAWLVSDSGGGAVNKDRSWRLRYGRALASLRLLSSWRA